jgi:hypothetical protein
MNGASNLPRFAREFFGSTEDFTIIGAGSIGGKARGLAFVKKTLAASAAATAAAGGTPAITVSIPRLTVLATDLFDQFLEQNKLHDIAHSDEPDAHIAHAFQRASLPVAIVGDLKALIDQVHQPLAIRSSSLLEDAMYRPFAGVYGTKMIPNNQLDADTRFRKLVEAIKFVWASTFFKDAKAYIRSTDQSPRDEKMAVIIQEVVGRRHGDRFYPDVAGVARSYNFYPLGHARPRDGVVGLALGLGRTIVDEGVAWNYSPAFPRANPPYASPGELLDQTQREFWAVNMGKPPAYDPVNEIEYLVKGTLAEAEADGTLRFTASTYDPQSDRLSPGAGAAGPRALTFAPLLNLEVFPLNKLVRALLAECEQAVGAEVEIEFAVTLPDTSDGEARFGFLQVRPLVVSSAEVAITPEEMTGPAVLAATAAALGNGTSDAIRDVVYLKPATFAMAKTREIAGELETIDRELTAAGRPYLLIGFGRWGSSDPWLGVPVAWSQIAGAKVIIEASLPAVSPDPSQGTHFFHNLTSFGVPYLTVRHTGPYAIDWAWLDRQPAAAESEHVRHVHLAAPLRVKVDGRTGCGVIHHPV